MQWCGRWASPRGKGGLPEVFTPFQGSPCSGNIQEHRAGIYPNPAQVLSLEIKNELSKTCRFFLIPQLPQPLLPRSGLGEQPKLGFSLVPSLTWSNSSGRNSTLGIPALVLLLVPQNVQQTHKWKWVYFPFHLLKKTQQNSVLWWHLSS